MTPEAKIALSRRSRTIPLILSLLALASGTLRAGQGDEVGIAGRWESTKKDLVLDISPCGAGYCGQLVKSDDQCDRTVLTVALKITLPQARDLTFDGELTLPGLPRVFKARVNVTRQNATSAAKMVIVGDDVEPNFVRRTFPFSAQLARIGDASCRPKTTS